VPYIGIVTGGDEEKVASLKNAKNLTIDFYITSHPFYTDLPLSFVLDCCYL
jgi:ribosomal protein L31